MVDSFVLGIGPDRGQGERRNQSKRIGGVE